MKKTNKKPVRTGKKNNTKGVIEKSLDKVIVAYNKATGKDVAKSIRNKMKFQMPPLVKMRKGIKPYSPDEYLVLSIENKSNEIRQVDLFSLDGNKNSNTEIKLNGQMSYDALIRTIVAHPIELKMMRVTSKDEAQFFDNPLSIWQHSINTRSSMSHMLCMDIETIQFQKNIVQSEDFSMIIDGSKGISFFMKPNNHMVFHFKVEKIFRYIDKQSYKKISEHRTIISSNKKELVLPISIWNNTKEQKVIRLFDKNHNYRGSNSIEGLSVSGIYNSYDNIVQLIGPDCPIKFNSIRIITHNPNQFGNPITIDGVQCLPRIFSKKVEIMTHIVDIPWVTAKANDPVKMDGLNPMEIVVSPETKVWLMFYNDEDKDRHKIQHTFDHENLISLKLSNNEDKASEFDVCDIKPEEIIKGESKDGAIKVQNDINGHYKALNKAIHKFNVVRLYINGDLSKLENAIMLSEEDSNGLMKSLPIHPLLSFDSFLYNHNYVDIPILDSAFSSSNRSRTNKVIITVAGKSEIELDLLYDKSIDKEFFKKHYGYSIPLIVENTTDESKNISFFDLVNLKEQFNADDYDKIPEGVTLTGIGISYMELMATLHAMQHTFSGVRIYSETLTPKRPSGHIPFCVFVSHKTKEQETRIPIAFNINPYQFTDKVADVHQGILMDKHVSFNMTVPAKSKYIMFFFVTKQQPHKKEKETYKLMA